MIRFSLYVVLLLVAGAALVNGVARDPWLCTRGVGELAGRDVGLACAGHAGHRHWVCCG